MVFVPVAETHVRFVGLNPERLKFVNEALVAKRFVVVTLVPVPFANVRFASEVVPVTEKLFKTVNAPVEVPPPNWISFVVMFPAFVTT